MNNIKLPSIDSATGKSIKTTIQAAIGAAITLGVGLILTIKGVPGCPEAVVEFLKQYFFQIAGALGISSGAVTFVWYLFDKKIKNY